MRLEIWAEIFCPWCGLGNHRLNQALKSFEHRTEVQVAHRSYLLDSPREATAVAHVLTAKFGVTAQRAVEMANHVEGLAARDGLQPYMVVNNRMGNTELAHEFLAYASAHDMHHEAWQLMFDKYFGEAAPVFTVDDLLPLADQLGLPRLDVEQALRGRSYRPQVEDDVNEASRLGATGVPFIVIDRRYAIPGAVDTPVLLRALREAWAHGHEGDD